MRKSSWLFFLIGACVLNVNAQDSLRTLNAEQVLRLVKMYHPVVKQAQLDVDYAKAEITLARGSFMPIISSYLGEKTLNGTNYYQQFTPEISIPTWYGLTLNAGSNELDGSRLNTSETQGQTSYAGIDLSLGKGLIIDKRRAALKQAKLLNTLALTQQKAVINEVLMQSMEAYWEWVKTYQKYQIINNNLIVNEQRYRLIVLSVFNGERAPIDTVEALTQLQSFRIQKNDAWLSFQLSGLQLSSFLWKADLTPYTLPEEIVPQAGWENEVNINNFNLVLPDLLILSARNNPNLLQYTPKIESLKIDQKLKFQELLPKLDVSYNALAKNYNLNTAGLLLNNNYQYGIKFEMPLFLNQGRGAYKQAKLKVKNTELEFAQKQLATEIKLKSYYNELVNLRQQIALQSSNYSYYRQLLLAEEAKLANGESSIFLVNSREVKALEAQEKLIALKTSYFKTIYALQWSAGLLL